MARGWRSLAAISTRERAKAPPIIDMVAFKERNVNLGYVQRSKTRSFFVVVRAALRVSESSALLAASYQRTEGQTSGH